MTSTVTTGLWQRFDHAEHALCLRVNRGCRYSPARRLFVAVSRLGDGIFWYALMVTFALSGPQGAFVAAQMAVAGLAGTAATSACLSAASDTNGRAPHARSAIQGECSNT